MYRREEQEYMRAKLKAARRLCTGWVKPRDLPSNAEIRDEIQTFARLHEGDARTANLREMRLEALRMMRLLRRWNPRLIGSVLTGHVRRGSDVDVHVFADSTDGLCGALEAEGMVYEIERKRVRKGDEERIYTHVRVRDRFPFELTVYPTSRRRVVFRSSITGKAIERASLPELEDLLRREYPGIDLDAAVAATTERVDRFQIYELLLLPLERVKQSPRHHPEGDALYHSLQVFELARNEIPYDEEFLLAALLHDVGKAIDPEDHVAAGLEALGEHVTERTRWLIEHHMEAQAVLDGTLGARAKRRLAESPDYEELLTLARCDRRGRRPGAPAPEVEEALEHLRELARTCGE